VAVASRIRYWQENLREPQRRLDYAAMAAEWKAENSRLGTVGCVAVDAHGRLAAGTSTGGTGQCYPGRVGDTPILGAGTYCTPKAAVSMTGVGERIMLLLSAKRLCDLVADGRPLRGAAQAVIAEIEGVRSHAGLIAVDAAGTLVDLRNTPFMACAKRRG
jgi:beta-aspartyl-peptidase (threonine type)